jgi:hypothetical protein
MMVGLLGRRGHGIRERHRRGEVAHLRVAGDRVAIPLPPPAEQSRIDLVVWKRRHRASLRWPVCAS